jgi:hypothetical protein
MIRHAVVRNSWYAGREGMPSEAEECGVPVLVARRERGPMGLPQGDRESMSFLNFCSLLLLP